MKTTPHPTTLSCSEKLQFDTSGTLKSLSHPKQILQVILVSKARSVSMADFWTESGLVSPGFFACLKTNHGNYCTIIKGNDSALIVGVSFESIKDRENPCIIVILGAERDLKGEGDLTQPSYHHLHCKIPLASLNVQSIHIAVIDKKNKLFEHYTHFNQVDNDDTATTAPELFSLSFTTSSIMVDSQHAGFPQFKIPTLGRKIQEFALQAQSTTSSKPVNLGLLLCSRDPETVLVNIQELGDVLRGLDNKNERKVPRRSFSPDRGRDGRTLRDRYEESNVQEVASSPFVASPGKENCSSTASPAVEKGHVRAPSLAETFVPTCSPEQIDILGYMKDITAMIRDSRVTDSMDKMKVLRNDARTPPTQSYTLTTIPRIKVGEGSEPTELSPMDRDCDFVLVSSPPAAPGSQQDTVSQDQTVFDDTTPNKKARFRPIRPKPAAFPPRCSSIQNSHVVDPDTTTVFSSFDFGFNNRETKNTTPTPSGRLSANPVRFTNSDATLHEPSPTRPATLLEQLQSQRELLHTSSPLSNADDIQFARLLKNGLPPLSPAYVEKEVKVQDLIDLSSKVLDLEKDDPRIAPVLSVINKVLEKLFSGEAI
ncbi:uncharacterized protein LY89DRAFT_77913 [Mollisia scopiformis]|uniref:Uncharacterized protein n=1 Tax=Mollisia scopiformis TaxID=149040 RepID=A0A194X7U9_MOLSC|nr:uncharacterized protein LY89DRAFT_77913 [Mollisia scopiformis]KUJ16238.1 hypothetical protein LY89DRAFT_77913 [Mollisia scopiformis]